LNETIGENGFEKRGWNEGVNWRISPVGLEKGKENGLPPSSWISYPTGKLFQLETFVQLAVVKLSTAL
jgi:hypothetical protein